MNCGDGDSYYWNKQIMKDVLKVSIQYQVPELVSPSTVCQKMC